MRSCSCTVPAIRPFGHHISVTSAPVSSTVPRQMHMSGLMSTLVRMMVLVRLSPSATVILPASLGAAGSLASFIRACSSTAGGGAAISLTPAVALPALASSIMALCFSLSWVSAGAERMTWFQSAPSSVTTTPRLAASFFTASRFAFGTDHFSHFVKGSTWPVTLAMRCFIDVKKSRRRDRVPLSRGDTITSMSSRCVFVCTWASAGHMPSHRTQATSGAVRTARMSIIGILLPTNTPSRQPVWRLLIPGRKIFASLHQALARPSPWRGEDGTPRT